MNLTIAKLDEILKMRFIPTTTALQLAKELKEAREFINFAILPPPTILDTFKKLEKKNEETKTQKNTV